MPVILVLKRDLKTITDGLLALFLRQPWGAQGAGTQAMAREMGCRALFGGEVATQHGPI